MQAWLGVQVHPRPDFIVSAGSQQNLSAFSKPDGKPKYEAAFTENYYENMVLGVNKMYAVGMILSSPVVADNAIYFGSTDGNLYAIH